MFVLRKLKNMKILFQYSIRFVAGCPQTFVGLSHEFLNSVLNLISVSFRRGPNPFDYQYIQERNAMKSPCCSLNFANRRLSIEI